MEIHLLFSRVIHGNRPCIWSTFGFLRNCQTGPPVSNMWMFWFLYILVNTWCSQVFPLTLAILIEGWSDIFWISFVTRDVKTLFMWFLVTPILFGGKGVHMTVEAKGQCCMSSSVTLRLCLWDSVPHCPGAHWPSRITCPSNLHDCASPGLDDTSIHVTVPRFLYLGTRDSNSGPCACASNTLPGEPFPL